VHFIGRIIESCRDKLQMTSFPGAGDLGIYHGIAEVLRPFGLVYIGGKSCHMNIFKFPHCITMFRVSIAIDL